MAKSIGTLKASLILDTNQWLGGFAKAGGITKSFFGGIASKVGGALGGIVSVGAAFHSLSQGMNQVDRQAKLADRLGITVGEVQKLSLAADLAGTDIELLARSMLKMGKNIGSGGQSLDKRLFQVADAIALIKDPAKRGAKAEEIFGKGGLELINVLTQGGRGIRASAEAIDRFGLAISRVDAAKIEAANDAWTEMKTVLGGLRNQIAVEMAPVVSDFLSDWLRGLENIIQRHRELQAQMKESTKDSTTWYDRFIALVAADAPWNIGSGERITGSQIVQGLLATREDQRRNAALAGRNTGIGLLGMQKLGGRSGTESKFAGALERGSVEAARAITGAGGNPLDKVAENTKQANDHLREIKRVMRQNGGLRPSNMGGL